MHKYIITGPQGCGKGTQAKMLKEDFDLDHISVGDMFRWNIQNHTKLASQINRIMAAGQLVPDSIAEEIVQQRLEQHDWDFGFILDGFPRNKHQAEFYLERYDVDAVIRIDVPDDVVTERILARRLCESCGQDCNLLFNPPSRPDVCDTCGGKLVAREDDTPEAIQGRLNDYHTQTEAGIDLFREKAQMVVTDGTRTPEEIQRDIRAQLGLGEG